MSEQEDWREKYLTALDELESQELDAKTQYEALLGLIGDFSFTCDGMDTELDDLLETLRGQMRQNSAELDTQSFSAGLRAYEVRKEQQLAAQRDSLERLLEALSLGFPSRENDVENFRRQMLERAGQWRHYQLLLARLDELCRDCLGLVEPEALTADQAVESFQAGSDDKVTERLRSMLLSWLGDLEPVTGQHRVLEHWRSRLQAELDWPSLLDALEDLRALVLVGYGLAGQNFSQYLQELSAELVQMLDALNLSSGAAATLDSAGQTLTNKLHTGIEAISTSLSQEHSLERLQGQVAGQIHQMQQALLGYQEQSSESRTQMVDQNDHLKQKLVASQVQIDELNKALACEREKALTDPLTKLPNRQSYLARSDQEWQRWQRYGGELTLALVDIDYFKNINDRFGHPAGDRVLALVAKLMSQRLRQVDYIARIGGEEFAILLPETGLEGAVALMDKLRESIAGAPVNFKGEPLTLTVSVGVAGFDKGDAVAQVYERADRALYQAKGAGRNQCMSVKD